ncbi:long-chain-fatty-acid--CoA ligase [Croceicoccus hydrothermalis]|uniref:long-chain-fatty-acid--CoA ligase n=1 Tax=Croceicoccus hydrothermalis TaxID=2867964 RepID=UPI001EFB2D6E
MQTFGDMPLLISSLLPADNGNFVPNEIVDAAGLRYGYPEFIRRIRKFANVLATLGVEQGETIAVLDWDSHLYLESYYAIPSMGCVLQTVNIRLSPEQVRYTISHAGAKTAIVHPEFVPFLQGEWKDGCPLERVILIGANDVGGTIPEGVTVHSDILTRIDDASADYVWPELDERATATRFYTSGTTGLPKAVFYSHRQIVLHTLAILATFGTSPVQGRLHKDDVYMPITPLFHAHAWGTPYAATLIGAKQVYPGRYVPEKLLRLIQDEGVTFSHCVASILQMLLDDPLAKEIDWKGRKMLIGGGPLPEGLARRALDTGMDIFSGYGMSETGPVQTINHLTTAELQQPMEEQVALRTRAGRPVVLCNIKAVSDDCAPLPVGVDGEIVFRSPWLTAAYADDAVASAELWAGSWLHSGDIGHFGADGALRITDRLKDVIKSGGEWISSQQLEGLISQVDGVSEVAVIGVPDEKWGERPLALIVPVAGAANCDKRVLDRLAELADAGVLPRYAVPETVKLVDGLARTSVGKLNKKVLRTLYGPKE